MRTCCYIRQMPAPLDWSAAGGLDSVKQLTMQVGPREAARRLGLSRQHGDALRQLCHRGNWLASVQRANVSPVPSGPVTMSGQPVTAVTTASVAFAEIMADDSKASKLAGSRYVRKTLEHAAELPPEIGLEQAQNVKATIASGATIHAWEAKAAPPNVVVNLALMGLSPEQVQVEAI